MLNTVLHYNPMPLVLPQDNQSDEIQSFFKSEGRNVYAFSDIHADINVLIIFYVYELNIRIIIQVNREG